jgi:hypothetical protein
MDWSGWLNVKSHGMYRTNDGRIAGEAAVQAMKVHIDLRIVPRIVPEKFGFQDSLLF